MKHPEREEWIPWICGEADGPTRERLDEHLAECSDCAREVAAWRRTLGKLDSWKLTKPAPALHTEPRLKWALAAMLVLGLGFAFGRVSARDRVDPVALRQNIESAVRASVQADLVKALQDVRDEQSSALARTEQRVAQASQSQSNRLWQNVLDTLASARAEDAQAIRTALQQTENRHDAEIVSVRKDLETLASMTDEEIRQARLKLIQLAALSASTQ
jgi:hypothetical protein